MLKKELPFEYNPELDEFLKKRNIFIHEFWRTYFSANKYDELKIGNFLHDLNNQTEVWERVFKDFLSILAKEAFENSTLETQTEKLKSNSFVELIYKQNL